MLLRGFRSYLGGTTAARNHIKMAQSRRFLQAHNWDTFLSWEPKDSKLLKSSVGSQVTEMDMMIKDVHTRAAKMDEVMTQVRGTCQGIIATTTQEAREIMADAEQRTKVMQIELAKWEEEKKRIASTHNVEPTVKLDIGGHSFITTLTTLTRFPDTVLGAMFSGRHALTTNEAGAHFIDRDGTYFREILNCLRSPESFDNTGFHGRQLGELKNEAEYYGMKDIMFPPAPEKVSTESDSSASQGKSDNVNVLSGICEDVHSEDTEVPKSLLGDLGQLDNNKVGNTLSDLKSGKLKLRYIVPHGEVRMYL